MILAGAGRGGGGAQPSTTSSAWFRFPFCSITYAPCSTSAGPSVRSGAVTVSRKEIKG